MFRFHLWNWRERYRDDQQSMYIWILIMISSYVLRLSYYHAHHPCQINQHTHTYIYIYKDFFFFFLHSFFILPITSFLSLSFAIPHRRKQITEKMRERQRNRETTGLPTHHITPHTYKNLILRSLSFSNAGIAWT